MSGRGVVSRRRPSWSQSRIDREAAAQRADPPPHFVFDPAILIGRRGKAVENVADHLADLAELGDTEPARRSSRGAEPHARGYGRFFGIERNAVLVAGQSRPFKARFSRLSGQPFRPQI